MQPRNNDLQKNPSLDEENKNISTPALYLDYARYERYFTDSDLTDEQKQEFLDTLWQIIVSFVDLGYGVHPLQQICGKDPAHDTEPATVQATCASTKESPHPINPADQIDVTGVVTERIPT